jgi:hypothetical protein
MGTPTGDKDQRTEDQTKTDDFDLDDLFARQVTEERDLLLIATGNNVKLVDSLLNPPPQQQEEEEQQQKEAEPPKEESVSNQYANEEVASNRRYPSAYHGFKSIISQVDILRRLIPELENATYDENIATQPLPPGAEGWVAIPRWDLIASTYNIALERVLALIRQTRRDQFYNWRKGKINEQYLRQSILSIRFWQQLGEKQKGHNILIVPAQFGLRHRGRSVRRAREVFAVNEFGLGAFTIGIMLLTHPERLHRNDNLWIDCAGDEYALGKGGDFSRAPYFIFFGSAVRFDMDKVDSTGGHCGSASAFLP